MPKQPDGPTLAELILNRKGDRSFDRVSQDCGGAPAGRRLQQLASPNREIKNFPDPETVTALARGLGVTPHEIVLASARSLGIRVASSDEDTLTIAHGGQLPSEAQEALLHIARTMLKMHASADPKADPAPGLAAVRELRPRPSEEELAAEWSGKAAYAPRPREE